LTHAPCRQTLALSGFPCEDDFPAAILESFPTEVRKTVPAEVALFLGRARVSVSADARAAARATDVFARFLASGYARAHKEDEAIEWLDVDDDRGFINYPFLSKLDPLLESVRSKPEFVRSMDTVRARWEHFEI
jgi:hypothetical protein